MELDGKFAAEVQDLNLNFFMLAREQIKRNKQKACYVFALSDDFADKIATMDMSELIRLANSPVILFQRRFQQKDGFWDKYMEAHENGNEDEQTVAKLHSVLMATSELPAAAPI